MYSLVIKQVKLRSDQADSLFPILHYYPMELSFHEKTHVGYFVIE